MAGLAMSVGILMVILGFIIAPFIWDVYMHPCKPERLESIAVRDSPWVVEQWMALCGFGISGPLEVRARNTDDGATMTIAVIDDPDHTTLSFNDSGDLVISLPNLVDIWDEKTQFGNVKVVYNYQPDDPDKRRMLRRFRSNPQDTEATLWYCRTIVVKLAAADKARRSKELQCPE